MKKTLVLSLIWIAGSAVGFDTQAAVECKHGTEGGVPYVSVKGGGKYNRVYFDTYEQRDAAEGKCVSLERDCSVVSVRVSNGDADGLGQHYNTYSELDRYVHGFSSSNYGSYDRCLRAVVGEVVEILEDMPGERYRPGTPRWGSTQYKNWVDNPLSPINKL